MKVRKSFFKTTYYLLKNLLTQPIFFLRGSNVEWSCHVGSGTIVSNSVIGKYCYIGPGVILNSVCLGNYCSIAPGVQIGGMEHSWWWGSTSTHLSKMCISNKKTIIGDDVWIAANATVKQGVRIGRGAVIGAGSVVLEDVPPYSIFAGVPAREIRKRFPDRIIKEIEVTNYWVHPPKVARVLLENIDYQVEAENTIKEGRLKCF